MQFSAELNCPKPLCTLVLGRLAPPEYAISGAMLCPLFPSLGSARCAIRRLSIPSVVCAWLRMSRCE
eukprot:2178419-Alexandrium_andersonii.AAC.1